MGYVGPGELLIAGIVILFVLGGLFLVGFLVGLSVGKHRGFKEGLAEGRSIAGR